MKIFMNTLGCPKNFNDSQVAAGILENAGHEIIDCMADADVVFVNTCGFINDAKRESIECILEAAGDKREDAVLVVSGCLSERYEGELFKEIPEIDIMVGVNEYEKLPDLLRQYAGKRFMEISHQQWGFESDRLRHIDDNPYTATIKIAEGCNNRCAYCIIPKIRGDYHSRSMEDIIAEAQQLAAKGCREIVLIAQDVTGYMDINSKQGLPELLRRLCRVEGLQWIRLMYCYEDKITDELIEVMATEQKICHYIDIPLQHCSDKILKLMRRRSTKKSMTQTIKKLRDAIPDIHIRTTLITGFPGEDKDDFNELMDFAEEMKFERLGVFAYSKEEGTEAAEMPHQVREDTKKKRANAIMRRQVDISLENNKKQIGKTLKVLVEGTEEDGSYIGRTEYDAPEIDNSVIFTSDRNISPGEFAEVMIIDAFDYDLVGKEV